jgi:hypothetical protein
MNCHAATAPCSSDKLTVAIVVPAINTLKNKETCRGGLLLPRYSGALLHQDGAVLFISPKTVAQCCNGANVTACRPE